MWKLEHLWEGYGRLWNSLPKDVYLFILFSNCADDNIQWKLCCMIKLSGGGVGGKDGDTL